MRPRRCCASGARHAASDTGPRGYQPALTAASSRNAPLGEAAVVVVVLLVVVLVVELVVVVGAIVVVVELVVVVVGGAVVVVVVGGPNGQMPSPGGFMAEKRMPSLFLILLPGPKSTS